MGIKNKLLIIVLLLGVTVIYVCFSNDCGILPKDANYKVVLDDELYTLTPTGLVEHGFIVDFEQAPFTETSYARFNKAQKAIYYAGISKLDINKGDGVPKHIPNTCGTRIAVSPDGNLLLFNCNDDSNIWMLDQKTKNKVKIVDDFLEGVHIPVWINDYQFLYKNTLGKIYLFDVKNMEKLDTQLGRYYLGEVTPDGKEILLSGRTETVLYNLDNHSIKKIINKGIKPECMIWLPDKKGFLYLKRERFALETAGLYYYSLEKKKDLRLIKNFSSLTRHLSTGFFVPPDVNVKLVDNKHNKRRSLPMTNSLIRICN